MILRRCHPITLSGAPSPPPAEAHAARGQAALEARQYDQAWRELRTAFHHEPSPARAAQLALVAPLAKRLSTSVDDLRQWLVLKRRDAQRAGDREASWTELEAVLAAFEAGARRLEQSQVALEQELATLRTQVPEPPRRRPPTLPGRKITPR